MPFLTLSLDKLVCINPGDVLGTPAEPYMLNFFFLLDQPFVQDPDPASGTPFYSGSAVVFSPVGPYINNLGVTQMTAGSVVDIPAAIGTTTVNVSPFIGPENARTGALGVISVLMEHDAFSEPGVQAIQNYLQTRIQNNLTNLVLTRPETPLSGLTVPPAFYKGDVEAAVARELNLSSRQLFAMAMGSMNLFENIASILHPDDIVDYTVFMVNLWDLAAEFDGTIEFEAELVNRTMLRKGAFQLYGHARIP